MPVATPVTTPVLVTVALVFPAIQVPPAAVSVRAIVLPRHTLSGPPMVPASAPAVTVTASAAAKVPHALVMV